MKTKICPRCEKEYTGYPALSREDNKTKICPDCGIREALKGMIKDEDIEEVILKSKKFKDKTLIENLRKSDKIITFSFEGDFSDLDECLKELNEYRSFSYRIESDKYSRYVTITGTEYEIVMYGIKYYYAGNIELARDDEDFNEILKRLEDRGV